MEFSFEVYLFIFCFIAFAGFIDSIAGGGGLISVPTYLAAGLPADFILGTNKTVSTSGATLAVIRYIKAGLIYWRQISYAIVAAIVGASIGSRLSAYLSEEYMVYLLIVITPVILYLKYKHVGKSLAKKKEVEKTFIFRSLTIGFLIGMYDGFFGPGTGSFFIIALVLFLNMDLKHASANARVLNYASNLSAFVYFLTQGKIMWSVAVVAITASLMGNYLGSHMVMKKSDKIVSPVFNFVLTLLLVKCIYDVFIK